MKEQRSVVDKLREGFAADEVSRAADECCPEPDRIWEAVHARLDPSNRREIVEHISRCAACAADWRVAMRSEEADALAAPPVRRTRWPVLAAAAAALVVVGSLAVIQLREDKPAPPVYRTGAQTEIRSLLPADEPLPRDRFVLRWSPIERGARYTVELDTLQLESLASVRDLEEARFVVPASALATLPSGETVVWQVEARLPDGRRIISPAFLTRIE